MTVFAKVFHVGQGQMLVRKNVVDNDDGQEVCTIECVFSDGDAYFNTTAFFKKKENRDNVFDMVNETSFACLAMFQLPSFFCEDGASVFARCSMATEPNGQCTRNTTSVELER